MSLSNQTVVVIGGSSGIGLAVARGALQLGARVIVGGRDAERLAAAAASSPGLETATLDITREDELAAFFERTGALDHLVVTAGALLGSSPLRTLDVAVMREAFDVKLTGSLVAAKHAARQLRPGGSIGFTSGVLARKPSPHAVVKTAVNAALEAAARQLARELAPLRVYAISPGPVNTPSWRLMDDTSRTAMFDKLSSTLPVGFAASDDDTAAGYLFAMQARALTGAVIDLDSGALVA
jgi:NAD(P)-dependent dehydrogenase (short-subunit alcohol dehydrogenase family)